MRDLDIDVCKTALLLMDCQNGILASLCAEKRDELLSHLRKILVASREAGLQIFYVVVQFRADYPEVSSGNERFAAAKALGTLLMGSESAQIHSEIEPHGGDIVVTKKRVSAFAGSDLEIILRAREIDTLVLTGVSTLGVVESTARSAADMDYRVVVLEDGCADSSLAAHNAAMQYVIPFSAMMASCDQFIQQITSTSWDR